MPCQAGFVDLNIYGDTRGFATITPSVKLDLGEKFSYFSFTNLDLDGDGGEVYRYYTEQDIYYRIGKTPLYLAQQYVSRSGSDNDLLRYGPRVVISDLAPLRKLFSKYNFYYEISAFPLQIDHSEGFDMGWEHFYVIKILPKFFKDRVYLSGFVDHNLEFGKLAQNHSIAVTENQVGIRIIDDLYLVSELRYNGYLPSEQIGLGLGLEYFKKF